MIKSFHSGFIFAEAARRTVCGTYDQIFVSIKREEIENKGAEKKVMISSPDLCLKSQLFDIFDAPNHAIFARKAFWEKSSEMKKEKFGELFIEKQSSKHFCYFLMSELFAN